MHERMEHTILLWPEQLNASNTAMAAMASPLQAGHQQRGVADTGCWAKIFQELDGSSV
jgi:hypothetical protein